MLVIFVHNDGTADEGMGNYDYKICINDRCIEEGRIENHIRKDGWRELVFKLVKGPNRCMKKDEEALDWMSKLLSFYEKEI